MARLAWLHADLLQSANDEIKKARREIWEPEPELIPNIQVYHYHNDHLGTPNELTNTDGDVVWLADYEAWGNTAKVVYKEVQLHNITVSADELQPLRFQGQSFDVETGLHYNRFRYYDPDLGMFISRDPIGLMGGNNVFQYAPIRLGLKRGDGAARHGPSAVSKVNNRNPINCVFAGKTMAGKDISDPKIRGKYPHGVPFNMKGFPDFSRYAIKTINLDSGFTGDYDDFKSANNLAFGIDNPYKAKGSFEINGEKYIWHHTEYNGKMQLIPFDIHDAVRHTGGAAVCGTRQ